MNFTPTWCRGWIELPSSWHDFWTCQHPLMHEANPSNIEVSDSKTSKTRISYRFGMFKAVTQAQSDYYETHLLHVCINLVHAFAIKATQQHGSHHHRGILAGGNWSVPRSHHCAFMVINYFKLHPLLSWGAYPKPFRKPAHSLKRMTSTGGPMHIGSSGSVWWILVTRSLPKLPKLVKAHSVFSDMHDPWWSMSSSESRTKNLHDIE